MSDRLILILTGGCGGGGGCILTFAKISLYTSSQTFTWRLYNEPDQTNQIGGDGYTDR